VLIFTFSRHWIFINTLQPHRRLFFLGRKYEYIALLKTLKGGEWMARKWADIKKAKREAEAYLQGICSPWTLQRLREEYAIQQKTQLSVRACK
jgi:hypothetical protein